MTSIEVDLLVNEITKILTTTDVQKLSFEFKKNESNENGITLNVSYKNLEDVLIKKNSFKSKCNFTSNVSKGLDYLPNFKDLETARSDSSLPDIMSSRFLESQVRCDGNCNKINPKEKMTAFGFCDHVICKNCRDQYKYVFKMFNLIPSCTNLQCLTSTLMTILKDKDRQFFKKCCTLYNNGDYKQILEKIVNS